MRGSSRLAVSVVALAITALGCAAADPSFSSHDGGARDAAGDATTALDARADANPTGTDAQPTGDDATTPPPDARPSDGGSGGFVCGSAGAGVDPYPMLTMQGEYTDPPDCAAGRCPAAFAGFTAMPNTDGSVLHVSGTAAGGGACRFVVVGSASGVEEGTLATDPDGGGMFTGAVPLFCGQNRVEIICCADHGNRVKVVQIEGRTCPGDDLRLTLTWDGQVRDGELHLIQQGAHINDPMHDCTWTTCVPPRTLDWGAPGVATDNPVKDVDNTSTNGTEHITLTSAPAGTYAIMAEHWSGAGSPGAMTVQINVQGRAPTVRSVPSIASHWVWYVGTITFPGGAFTPSDAMSPPHTPPLTDCTGTRWTSPGCGLPIPQ